MKVALITGAARGIGEGLARALAAKGYQVSLVGLEFERLKMIASEIGGIAFEADVTSSQALEFAVKGTLERFGKINVVVANAGIANNGSFASTHVDDLVRVVDVNLSGCIRTLKATFEALSESRGYALVISSAAAFPALPGITAYGASKAGVDHLANNLRIEMEALGVEIGVAYPSWVDTDLVRDQYEELSYFKKALESSGPLGQIMPLDEAVAILVEGIESRKRRIYIPESVAWLHALRSLAVSKVWDLVVSWNAKRIVPKMSEDARDLGRSFGRTSVETTERRK